MQAIKSIPSPSSRRPTSLELAATIQLAREAAARLRRRVGRFEIYDLLEAIYRVYIDWKRRKIAKRSARVLADRLSIVRRKGMSPIRVLIEATLPSAAIKQKSRWVRALEYVHSENVSPSQFRKFIRTRGGIAGCADLAVNLDRKRRPAAIGTISRAPRSTKKCGARKLRTTSCFANSLAGVAKYESKL
jgi:hypothetical protein